MILQQLKNTPEAKRPDVLLNYISGLIGEIVDLASTEVWQREQKLFELGLRSRNLIELKVRLETVFSVDLPVTLFFAYSTMGTLTDYLLTEVLQLTSEKSVNADGAFAPRDSTTKELKRIEELTEEEAEVLLLKKISEVDKK